MRKWPLEPICHPYGPHARRYGEGTSGQLLCSEHYALGLLPANSPAWFELSPEDQAKWEKMAKKQPLRFPDKPRKADGRYIVDCRLITNGELYSDWQFVSQTLADAKECCDAQMAPSDLSLIIGHNFECNKSRDAYVNCTISYLRANGKFIVLDERINPVAVKGKSR